MSNTVIQILRSYTSNTPNSLADGQMAYSFISNTLFIGDANNDIIPIGGESYILQLIDVNAGQNVAIQYAYDQANAATNSAQYAYNNSNVAYTQANAATISAQAAYDNANAAVFQIVSNTAYQVGVNTTQNNNITAVQAFAQGAFNSANTNATNLGYVNGYAAGAFALGNTNAFNITATNNYATSGYNTANSAQANTIYTQGVDATQNTRLTSLETVNVNQNTSIAVIQGVDTTQNTWISSNVAYFQGIENTQNSSITVIQGVDLTQNTQISGIQGVDLAQNSAISIIQGVDLTQNTWISSNAAYFQGIENTQNTQISGIQGVDLAQNSSITIIQGVDLTQNTQIAGIQGVDNIQNTNITAINTYATSAYNQANATVGVDATQNTQIAGIQGVDLAQNSSITIIQGVDLGQNAAIAVIQGVDLTQNTNITAVNTYAASAYNQANVTVGVDATQNTQISGIQGVDLTQNTNISLLQGAVATANANIAYILGVDLTQNTNITAVNNYATSAYNQANVTAGGLVTANSNISTIQGVNLAQNSAITIIQGVDLGQNSAITVIQGVDVGQNAAIAVIQGVDATQNTQISGIQGVDLTQNTNISLLQGAMTSANANIASLFAIDTTQNTNITAVNNYATSAYNQANVTAGGLLTANSNIGVIQGVDLAQNSAINIIQGVDVGQNAAIAVIQGVDATQNTNITAVNTYAQSAYNKANNSLQLSGTNQTVSSNVNIQGNLTVSGNVSYTGNVTSVQITGNTGQFFGYAANGFQALYAGVPTGYFAEPQMILQLTSNFNGYSGGINMQNENPGQNSSSDLFITADNGTSNDGYLDLGLGSSTYSYPGYNLIGPNDGYLFTTGNTTTGGGNMIVGTGLNNDVIFATGGINKTNEVMRITAANTVLIKSNAKSISTTSGALQVSGGIGVQGNVYATGVYDNGTELLSYFQGITNTQNTNTTAINTYATSAYNQANATAGGLVTANSNITVIQGVDATQNTQISGIQGVDLAQNSAISIIQGVDLTQNTNITAINNYVTSAYNQANVTAGGLVTANSNIQSAWNTANNALANTGALLTSNTPGLTNYLLVTSNSSGNPPTISAVGLDPNIGMSFVNQGNGAFTFTDTAQSNYLSIYKTLGSNEWTVSANNTSNLGLASSGGGKINFYNAISPSDRDFVVAISQGVSTNYLQAAGSPTGISPVLSAQTTSAQANVDITLLSLGAGNLNFATANSGTQLRVVDSGNPYANAWLQIQNWNGVSTSKGTIISQQFSGGYPSGTESMIFQTNTLGGYQFQTGPSQLTQFNIPSTAASANYLQAKAAITGSGPSLSTQGTDTNADLNIQAKGTGNVNLIGANTNITGNLYATLVYSGNNLVLTSETIGQAAYNQANAATISAQSGYNLANTVSTTANAAFNQANTVALYTAGVDATQNTNITAVNNYATSAYNQANVTVGVDATQNTNISLLQGAMASANANIAYILGIDATQNTNITAVNTFAQSAYNQANTDYTTLTIPSITTSSNGLYVPVISVAANGRITSVSNVSIVGGGTSSNSFATINAGSTSIVASSNNDTLSFANSGGIVIIGNPSTKTITQQIVGYSSFLAPFSGTLTSSQIGALVQIGGNVTLPNANSCPAGGTFTFTNETSNQWIITVGGGADFLYHNPLLNSSNKSIAINSGETLQIASRGSTEWDCVGGTALLKYTQTTNVNSLVISSGAGGSITFADGTVQSTAASGSATDQTARNLANSASNLASSAYNQANATNNLASSAYNQANTANTIAYSTVLRAGDTMTGALNIASMAVGTTYGSAALSVGGNIVGNNGIYIQGSGYFGSANGTSKFSNFVISAIGNNPSYTQLVVQNGNSSVNSSTDLVATADNGSDSDTYIDLGINSSSYNQVGFGLTGPNDGYLYVSGNTSTGGGNLILNTTTQKDIIFGLNGGDYANEYGRWKFGQGLTLKNLPLTFADGTSQNTAGSSVANTIYIQGVDLTQNTNISLLQGAMATANANIAVLFGIEASQNANIVSLQTLANTDYTTITSPAGTFGSGTLVPVVTVAANGRVTNISTTAVSGGGGGSLSNSFSTIVVSGQPNVIANTPISQLTFVAGSNMTITTVGTSNTITFSSTGGGGSANSNTVSIGANTSNSTIVPTTANTIYEITALATNATIAAPIGTPVDGQKLILRIKDNGTSWALTWTITSGGYRAVNTSLPNVTTAGRTLYVGCIYNAQDTFWDAVAVSQY